MKLHKHLDHVSLRGEEIVAILAAHVEKELGRKPFGLPSVCAGGVPVCAANLALTWDIENE